jgi:hypothetical protein
VSKADPSHSGQRRLTRSPSFGEVIPTSDDEDEGLQPVPFKSPFPQTGKNAQGVGVDVNEGGRTSNQLGSPQNNGPGSIDSTSHS